MSEELWAIKMRLNGKRVEDYDSSGNPRMVEFSFITRSEEGDVMATVLAYVIADLYSSGRADILAEFRANPEMGSLLQRGMTVGGGAFAVRECQPDPENQASPESRC